MVHLEEVLLHSPVLADYADCDEGVPDYVIPPLRFALVEKGVYRSGYPNLGNQLFLEKLQLRSILYLCKEPIREWNQAFIQRNKIELLQLGTDGNKEPFSVVPLETLKTALSIILDTRNHPILIHCHKGTHRTGCLVGCLRKVQQWSLTSILSEYQRFAGAKPRLLDQQSIELFNPNIIDLDRVNLPIWLNPSNK